MRPSGRSGEGTSRPGAARPGPGTAAPASGAATRRWRGARWTARPARSPACKRLNARCSPVSRSLVLRSPTGACQCSRVLAMPPKPPIQQAGDLDIVQHLVKPCQLDELVLVAAARPATVAPQQVAPDGRQRQALGGVGVAFGVVQHLLVGP